MKFRVKLAWVAVSAILLLWGGRLMLFQEHDNDNNIKTMLLRFRELGNYRFSCKVASCLLSRGAQGEGGAGPEDRLLD